MIELRKLTIHVMPCSPTGRTHSVRDKKRIVQFDVLDRKRVLQYKMLVLHSLCYCIVITR